MIKGIWNLLFDLPPMLLTIHCRHYWLDQHLFFSFSHQVPRIRSIVVDQKLTRLTPQLIQIEIYISTKLFFIVQQLFFFSLFFHMKMKI